MAKLPVECDFCGRSFTVPSSMIGQKVACECGSFIHVSEGEAEPAPGPEETGDVAREGWYVHRGGESVGPHSLEDMRDMARRGELQPEQNVYNPGDGRWQAASSLSVLSGDFPPPAVSKEPAGSGERRWYVRAGEEKYGPYTADRLLEMVEKNQLRARSRIWNAELDDWVEMRSVEPFSSIWGGAGRGGRENSTGAAAAARGGGGGCPGAPDG